MNTRHNLGSHTLLLNTLFTNRIRIAECETAREQVHLWTTAPVQNRGHKLLDIWRMERWQALKCEEQGGGNRNEERHSPHGQVGFCAYVCVCVCTWISVYEHIIQWLEQKCAVFQPAHKARTLSVSVSVRLLCDRVAGWHSFPRLLCGLAGERGHCFSGSTAMLFCIHGLLKSDLCFGTVSQSLRKVGKTLRRGGSLKQKRPNFYFLHKGAGTCKGEGSLAF